MVKSDDNLDNQSQNRFKDSFVGSELSVLDIRWRGKLKGQMRKKFILVLKMILAFNLRLGVCEIILAVFMSLRST